MADYLLLRLYGPLASWGEIAVGESRHSAAHPSRSALLGLLGAALGVEREDDAAQQALSDGYRFGIQLESPGSPLRDYHTVQIGVPPRKAVFRSRRQELLADKVETVLSAREYRCDSLALVAIEALPSARWSLAEVGQALTHPHFPLYLGRKSCPLALPLKPVVHRAATLREAFVGAPADALLQRYFRQALLSRQVRCYWEDGMQSGMTPAFETSRHDQPLTRRRWQFAPRGEWVALEQGAPT